MSKYSEQKDFTYKSSDGKHEIAAKVWEDEKVDPRAVLQIAHGMQEYKDRYNRFAKWLSSRGILVCANDHLGHGDSVANKSEYGYVTESEPAKALISDMHTLRTIMQAEYPDLPYFMLGHSMGSYLLRTYLSEYGEGLSGAIIMGTGGVSEAVSRFGIHVCKVRAMSKGWDYKSNTVEKLSFGSKEYKQYDMTGKDKDNNWLTHDREVLTKYYQDPKCAFKFTLSGYTALFEAVAGSANVENNIKIPHDLPLFLVSGSEDPVGEMGRGVQRAYGLLRDTGHDKVEMKLYEGARHEILNDICRDEVFEDIRNWIMKHI